MASAKQLAERKARVSNFQLHPRKSIAERPMETGNSPDQMKVFQRFHSETARNVENLIGAIFEPTKEQAEMMDDLFDQLADRIEAGRYSLGLEK
jgi:hypothetical protein